MGDHNAWIENPVYDDPDAAVDGVSRLFPSDARLALDAQLHERRNQELTPIDPSNPMEDPDVMKGYVSSTLGTRERWDELTEEERRDAITGASGRAAGTAHPGTAVNYIDTPDMEGMVLEGGTVGMTNPWTGNVLSDPSGFSGDELTADTVNTLYHETTHAEQVQLVRDVQAQGGPVSDRDFQINYEMNLNLGTSIVDPEPGTTMWVEQHSDDGPDGYDAYRGLRAEREAHAAGDAAERMFSRMSAVHDELREYFEGSDVAEDSGEPSGVDTTDSGL